MSSKARQPDQIDCCTKYTWAVCLTVAGLTFIPFMLVGSWHVYCVYTDKLSQEMHLREIHEYNNQHYCLSIDKVPAGKRDYKACDITGHILRTSPQTEATHATIKDVFGDFFLHSCQNESVCALLFSQLLETIRSSYMGAFLILVLMMVLIFACGYIGPYRACMTAKRTRERQRQGLPFSMQRPLYPLGGFAQDSEFPTKTD